MLTEFNFVHFAPYATFAFGYEEDFNPPKQQN